jgi:hypothetical protein
MRKRLSAQGKQAAEAKIGVLGGYLREVAGKHHVAVKSAGNWEAYAEEVEKNAEACAERFEAKVASLESLGADVLLELEDEDPVAWPGASTPASSSWTPCPYTPPQPLQSFAADQERQAAQTVEGKLEERRYVPSDITGLLKLPLSKIWKP